MEHPSFFLARAAFAWAALLAAHSPAAAVEPLSLGAALQSALAHSRSLDASNAAARGAREMAVAAAQRPDPVLRLSLEELALQGTDRFGLSTTMRSIALMQTLPSADKRQARGARFEREAEAALSERTQRVAALQTEVAQAWLERRLQEQSLHLLRAQIDEAQLLVQTTDAVLRGGKGSSADALAAREAQAQLEQALIAAQAEVAKARLTLARFTGGPPEQPLAGLPTMQHSPLSVEKAAQLPDLVALQAREAVARAEAELARQELRPDWSAELMFSQRGSPFPNTVSIGVSVPLQWDRPQRQQRELAARLARVNELQAEREEQTRERALQVQRWQLAWRAGRDRLAFLDTQRQPLAQQRVDAALAAYRGGREGLGPVLQARRDALSLAQERLTLEHETAGLWARLDYLFADTPAGVTP